MTSNRTNGSSPATTEVDLSHCCALLNVHEAREPWLHKLLTDSMMEDRCPLPTYWARKQDKSTGKIYFAHLTEKRSSWEHPYHDMFKRLVSFVRQSIWQQHKDVSSIQKACDEELRRFKEELAASRDKNWKSAKSTEGEVYYFNTKTGESTWDNPEESISCRLSAYTNALALITHTPYWEKLVSLAGPAGDRPPEPADTSPKKKFTSALTSFADRLKDRYKSRRPPRRGVADEKEEGGLQLPSPVRAPDGWSPSPGGSSAASSPATGPTPAKITVVPPQAPRCLMGISESDCGEDVLVKTLEDATESQVPVEHPYIVRRAVWSTEVAPWLRASGLDGFSKAAELLQQLPLPTPWHVRTGRQGERFFHHRGLGHTQWDHPLGGYIKALLEKQSSDGISLPAAIAESGAEDPPSHFGHWERSWSREHQGAVFTLKKLPSKCEDGIVMREGIERIDDPAEEAATTIAVKLLVIRKLLPEREEDMPVKRIVGLARAVYVSSVVTDGSFKDYKGGHKASEGEDEEEGEGEPESSMIFSPVRSSDAPNLKESLARAGDSDDEEGKDSKAAAAAALPGGSPGGLDGLVAELVDKQEELCSRLKTVEVTSAAVDRDRSTHGGAKELAAEVEERLTQACSRIVAEVEERNKGLIAPIVDANEALARKVSALEGRRGDLPGGVVEDERTKAVIADLSEMCLHRLEALERRLHAANGFPTADLPESVRSELEDVRASIQGVSMRLDAFDQERGLVPPDQAPEYIREACREAAVAEVEEVKEKLEELEHKVEGLMEGSSSKTSTGTSPTTTEFVKKAALVELERKTEEICEATRKELTVSLREGMVTLEAGNADIHARLGEQEAKRGEMEAAITTLAKSMEASHKTLTASMAKLGQAMTEALPKKQAGQSPSAAVEKLMRSHKEAISRLADRYDGQRAALHQIAATQERVLNAVLARKAPTRPLSPAAASAVGSPQSSPTIMPSPEECRRCLGTFNDVLKRNFDTTEEAYQHFANGATRFGKEMLALRLKQLGEGSSVVVGNKAALWAALCDGAGIERTDLMDFERWAKVVTIDPVPKGKRAMPPRRKYGKVVKYVAASVLAEAAYECTRVVAATAWEEVRACSPSLSDKPVAKTEESPSPSRPVTSSTGVSGPGSRPRSRWGQKRGGQNVDNSLGSLAAVYGMTQQLKGDHLPDRPKTRGSPTGYRLTQVSRRPSWPTKPLNEEVCPMMRPMPPPLVVYTVGALVSVAPMRSRCLLFSGVPLVALAAATEETRALAGEGLPHVQVKCSVSNLPTQDDKPDGAFGFFTLAIFPAVAPIGFNRFMELITSHFYDNTRVFRVEPGFVAQFGISGSPDAGAKWLGMPLVDEPVRASNVRGSITFAKADTPNSRTTQVFINTGDNTALDRQNFAPIGTVIQGMDVVDRFNRHRPDAKEPAQERIMREGNAYLDAEYPELTRIDCCWLLEPPNMIPGWAWENPRIAQQQESSR
ncbi:hypothetical protein FOL46_007475 [Perkinsus olseni]|uniref:peptidylprolyl isomerase n=1 Tax=Perkinsus olseni TaxID=32597 RepID=A0A7J6MP22_PEROL|nr:hypothetical protein FOL46_007475 [Perkinsus olseni]